MRKVGLIIILFVVIIFAFTVNYMTVNTVEAISYDSEIILNYKKNDKFDNLIKNYKQEIKSNLSYYFNEKQFKLLEKIANNTNEIFLAGKAENIYDIYEISDLNSVIGIDFGMYSFMLRFWMMGNLSREDGLFKLTEDLKREMGLVDSEIYFKYYKKYLLISFSKDYLIEYHSNIKKDRSIKYNEFGKRVSSKGSEYSLLTVIDINKLLENLNISISDYKIINNLGILSAHTEFENNRINIISEINGDGALFTALKSKSKDKRRLTKYISEDRIYINSDNFPKIAELIFDFIKATQGLDYPMIIKLLAKIDVYDLIDSLNGELIFNIGSKQISGLAQVDNPEKFKNLFKVLGLQIKNDKYILGEYSVGFKENILYLNKMLKESTESIEIANETIYAKLNIKTFIRKDYGKDLYSEIFVENRSNKLNIDIKFDRDDINSLIESLLIN